jgi:excisionase family DNA binding protein
MATSQAPSRSDGRLLLDLPQVADALSLSLRSVQNLIYRGQLRSLTVGRSRRVALADLAAFVEDLRASP